MIPYSTSGRGTTKPGIDFRPSHNEHAAIEAIERNDRVRVYAAQIHAGKPISYIPAQSTEARMTENARKLIHWVRTHPQGDEPATARRAAQAAIELGFGVSKTAIVAASAVIANLAVLERQLKPLEVANVPHETD